MKLFTESLRYEYPLTPDSVVFDVGAYEGTFAREIYRRYGCNVFCFEPVWYDELSRRLKDLSPKVIVLPYGLGDKFETVKMGVKGDSTGVFAESERMVDAQLYDVVGILMQRTVPIGLLKLNCEGGEFSILEAILDRGNPRLIENIQVQPHHIVPDYESRWQRIHERLLETHDITFHAPWCWSGYTIKK